MHCKINFLFIPYHNSGGHFIDWSIRYVSDSLNLLNEPAADYKNWHHYKPILTQGFEEARQTIKHFQTHSTSKFENIYISLLGLKKSVQQLYYTTVENATVEQRANAEQYIVEDAKKLLQWAQEESFTPVIIDYCSTDIYSMFYNDRNVLDWNGNACLSMDEKIKLFEETFFSNTTNKFNDTIWDLREKVALTYSFPKQNLDFDRLYNKQLPHLYYTTDDIWNDFPAVLIEICEKLGIETNPEKINSWQHIYSKWRTVHDPYFGRHLDRIIDGIINDYDVSLTRFKLNFFKEALIQHVLIKKHNLNLKNWQLDKFPNNTRDLHKLLEPNIHES